MQEIEKTLTDSDGMLVVSDDYTIPSNFNIDIQVIREDTGVSDLRYLSINGSETEYGTADEFSGGGLGVTFNYSIDEESKKLFLTTFGINRIDSLSSEDPHLSTIIVTITDDGGGDTGLTFIEEQTSYFEVFVQVGQLAVTEVLLLLRGF